MAAIQKEGLEPTSQMYFSNIFKTVSSVQHTMVGRDCDVDPLFLHC